MKTVFSRESYSGLEIGNNDFKRVRKERVNEKKKKNCEREDLGLRLLDDKAMTQT